MVTEFGMSEKLGPLAFGKREEMIFLGREIGEQRNYSDEVARMIDDEVRAIIDKAHSRATEVLTAHKDRLTELAEALVAKETIEADEFAAMFADLPDPRSEPGGSPTPKLSTPLGAGRVPEGEKGEAPQPAAPRQAPGPSPQPA
jgi:cell division protease FtsH